MARSTFNFISFLIRLVFAVILVYASYNPSHYSFYHWVTGAQAGLDPLMIFCGVVLVIGWSVYIRATLRSLGPIGLILATAFFGSMVWLILDWGEVPMNNDALIGYLVLGVCSAILAVGMSWSHVRRRLSGQADVDEIEEG